MHGLAGADSCVSAAAVWARRGHCVVVPDYGAAAVSHGRGPMRSMQRAATSPICCQLASSESFRWLAWPFSLIVCKKRDKSVTPRPSFQRGLFWGRLVWFSFMAASNENSRQAVAGRLHQEWSVFFILLTPAVSTSVTRRAGRDSSSPVHTREATRARS